VNDAGAPNVACLKSLRDQRLVPAAPITGSLEISPLFSPAALFFGSTTSLVTPSPSFFAYGRAGRENGSRHLRPAPAELLLSPSSGPLDASGGRASASRFLSGRATLGERCLYRKMLSYARVRKLRPGFADTGRPYPFLERKLFPNDSWDRGPGPPTSKTCLPRSDFTLSVLLV